MKKIYRNFTNKKEILDSLILNEKKGVNIKIQNTKNKFVNKVNKLSEDFNFNIKEQSYWLIEHKPGGHAWHRDTGTGNHMTWCQVGVSLLLKKADDGGETYYSSSWSGKNSVKVERDLYDLVAHTSDEWHMVKKHKGERIVFLMFI